MFWGDSDRLCIRNHLGSPGGFRNQSEEEFLLWVLAGQHDVGLNSAVRVERSPLVAPRAVFQLDDHPGQGLVRNAGAHASRWRL